MLAAQMMRVDKPTAVQILVARRDNKCIVARNAVEVGAYAYRTHAMDMARSLAAQAHEAGLQCYLLIRDQDGQWEERPCPKPRQPPSGGSDRTGGDQG